MYIFACLAASTWQQYAQKNLARNVKQKTVKILAIFLAIYGNYCSMNFNLWFITLPESFNCKNL